MTTTWTATPLSSFIALQRGYDLPSSTRRPGPIPVMGSAGVSGYHDEAKARGPGVIVGRAGASMGVASYCHSDYWPLNTALFVKDFRGNDPRFVFYLLESIDFRGYDSGSAQPMLNRNYIANLEVNAPPYREQRRIAAVLGALDDKIELNRQMNQTLEEMAQAIFNSWFVDFDGHDDLVDSELGLIPRGWAVESLDGIATYLNGAACQKYQAQPGEPDLPVIKIRELNQGIGERTDRATAAIPAKWHVNDGDVLFSWSGTLLVTIWAGGPGALNQHLFKVTSDHFPKWFFYLWTRHHLKEFQRAAAAMATTMGHIKRQHLADAKVLVPPLHTLEAQTGTVAPLLDRWLLNELESRTLTQLLDTLLPKLISGEIRVPEAEAVVEAAT